MNSWSGPQRILLGFIPLLSLSCRTHRQDLGFTAVHRVPPMSSRKQQAGQRSRADRKRSVGEEGPRNPTQVLCLVGDTEKHAMRSTGPHATTVSGQPILSPLPATAPRFPSFSTFCIAFLFPRSLEIIIHNHGFSYCCQWPRSSICSSTPLPKLPMSTTENARASSALGTLNPLFSFMGFSLRWGQACNPWHFPLFQCLEYNRLLTPGFCFVQAD